MKKFIFPLLLASSILLTGCQKGSKDIVLEMEAGAITKEDLYEEMKKTAGETALKKLVYQKIVANEFEVENEEVENEINKMREQFKTEEDFLSSLRKNNIRDLDELKNEIKHSLAYFKFSTKDIDIPEEKIKEVYEDRKESLKVAHSFA